MKIGAHVHQLRIGFSVTEAVKRFVNLYLIAGKPAADVAAAAAATAVATATITTMTMTTAAAATINK